MGCAASSQKPGGREAPIKKVYQDPDADAVAPPRTPPQFGILGVGEVADQEEGKDPAVDAKKKRPSVTFVRNPLGYDSEVARAPPLRGPRARRTPRPVSRGATPRPPPVAASGPTAPPPEPTSGGELAVSAVLKPRAPAAGGA